MRRDDVQLPTPPTNDRPNDRYRCGSCPANGIGGTQGTAVTCALGPTSRGKCRSDKDPCIPEATAFLRRQRRQATMVIIGCALIVAGIYGWGRDFYKPGDLSTPHAQILSGQLTSASCAACHPQAETSPLQWFLSGHPRVETVQTDRCMDCHHTRLPQAFARNAHNLAADALAELTATASQVKFVKHRASIPKPAFAMDDIACNACHREHAGPEADITKLSQAQCQTCHKNQFESFALGHPDWNDWPYTYHQPIAFDHRSHSMRHYPSSFDDAGNAIVFNCTSCHPKSSDGNFTRVTSYESACASCHDKSLKQQSGQRLDLFVLPSLAEPDPNKLPNWPVAATSFYDGQVGPLTRLLFGKDASIQSLLSAIPGEGNFARVRPTQPEQVSAATEVAVALRQLLWKMGARGPAPLASDAQPDLPALASIVRDLPPQMIWDAGLRWFGAPDPKDIANIRPHRQTRVIPIAARINLAIPALRPDEELDPLLEDSADSDPLLESDGDDDPLSDSNDTAAVRSPSSSRFGSKTEQGYARPSTAVERPDFDPERNQPYGGWYIDETRMAISYRAGGHADAVLKSAIELAAGLPADSSVRRDLLKSGPAAACIQCHRGVSSSGQFQWTIQSSSAPTAAAFTKFNHAPHMNLPALATCTHCHQIDPLAVTQTLDMSTFTSTGSPALPSLNGPIVNSSVENHSHDFMQMKRQMCATCHTASAAGDSCTKCHFYHPPSFTHPNTALPPAAANHPNDSSP